MKSPCYKDGHDCPKRHPLCHMECKAYIEFEQESRERRTVHLLTSVTRAYSMEQHEKNVRKQMKKGGKYGRTN